jgi:hypothetical protein
MHAGSIVGEPTNGSPETHWFSIDSNVQLSIFAQMVSVKNGSVIDCLLANFAI